MNLIYETILANLENEMLEAKRIWYKNGRQEEWDKMWGITLRHRYEDSRKRLKEAFEMQGERE